MDGDPEQEHEPTVEAFDAAAEEFDDQEQDGKLSALGDPAAALGSLVEYLARNLTDEPDEVEVEARRQGNNVVITLRVPESELGKVIGRQGRIARAVRTALTIAGSRHHVRASLDIEG